MIDKVVIDDRQSQTGYFFPWLRRYGYNCLDLTILICFFCAEGYGHIVIGILSADHRKRRKRKRA